KGGLVGPRAAGEERRAHACGEQAGAEGARQDVTASISGHVIAPMMKVKSCAWRCEPRKAARTYAVAEAAHKIEMPHMACRRRPGRTEPLPFPVYGRPPVARQRRHGQCPGISRQSGAYARCCARCASTALSGSRAR